ncbi:rho GTPase-activating protein 20-like protein [Lates japonicus]|uniref:Rho GTPase-activating protein 20-like protein n=1 Tax=Lates japonicus TaxID=270547 RepID=A0AAD3RDA2_LATJO|nr:rho GTPase-activating protein 20-like protein [Lates japonicus]
MSPQQQQDSLGRGGGQQENKRRMKSQSYRRQSAPSLVITKALTRSKTLSRESFLVPVCPETCPLVQSFLTGSDRSFLLHGHAQLKTGMQTQDRHLFLFNDILVIAKAKSANHFKQKAWICVCEMWTAGCMDEVCEGSTNPERSFVMGWPTCNCVATFSSAEQKEKWLSLLKSRIKEEKEREEPKTIPLRVYGKGINTFAVTKTLPVSNSDSTNEVIRLALQQFSIIGNVKDYQLWVISKRDNAPYPLIGHEFPFSIQMSHVRHTMSQGGSAGGRDAAAAAPPADRQKAMQVEQLQVYKQCQFILKPRPAEPLQQHESADLSQKPFKRRRSLITWAFWRGSSSHLNELSFAGVARGCLFSQPLSSVCVEDALPKPVMDMLAFLYHEGSWTRGIFRRPAGARAVRELRDSLDAGEFQLPLTRDHVFVIAGVFKDFLRSIPGSLLCCELHEEWMDVLEEEEEEDEQVQDIQRMICRLPKGNALLLRYLLAVLHGIQGNEHENQMTSFNLSVCIAPSMLWPPGAPCSPEVEGEGTKKVCELVKFMIEHCQQILGEDPSSLFGGPPTRLNTDETGSELGTSPKDSPPKEPLNWGTLKACRGLHPNSWLRKDRRLSLTQQDNLDKEEEDKTGGGPTEKLLTLGKAGGGGKLISSSQQKPKVSRATKDSGGGGHVKGRPGHEPQKPQHLKQDSSSPPSHHCSTGSLQLPKSSWVHSPDSPPKASPPSDSHASPTADITNQRRAAESEVNELKQPSLSLFYKQSGPALSLFKQHKSHSVEEERNTRLYQRRGSEPGRQLVDRAPTLTRARLPSDPGLKVSEVDSKGETAEARFCLSPYATKAVRDYFSSHPRSNPQSSQQVALALVESRREWLKRCSDPSAEPDFDQLLFAEESYV